ncbi:hypothetical protein C8F01DRAFT_1290922 [Mycena amicta]|nr:hypothetical protein C8F01DRAFT_1290922 [Mycena amicta]
MGSTKPARYTADSSDSSSGSDNPLPSPLAPKSKVLDLAAIKKPAAGRHREPSAKQKENESRAQAQEASELAKLKKKLAKEQKKSAHLAAMLRHRDAEDTPLESEEEEDIPISQFSSSFSSKLVASSVTNLTKPKKLRKIEERRDSCLRAHAHPHHNATENISAGDDFEFLRAPSDLDLPNDDTFDLDPPRTSDDIIPTSDDVEPLSRKRTARSPSPESARRRKHAKSTPAIEVPPRKQAEFVAGKPPGGSRTKLEHYKADAADLIKRARYAYELRIWTVDAFPSIETQTSFVAEVWAEVMEECGESMQLTERMSSMIKAYGSHGRGAIINAVSPLVDAKYDLEGEKDKVIAECKMLLKHDAFHHKIPATLEGFAQHPIVKLAIQKAWFPNKRGRAIKHSSSFSPISIPSLALIFTAIEYCIDRYSTGEYDTDAVFDEAHNKLRYVSHLKSIADWAGLLPPVTTAFRQRLHDECRQKVGAPVIRAAVVGLSEERRERALRELEAMQVDMGV